MELSKRFNLTDAKDGAPIKTRFGNNLRIICWDRISEDKGCVVGLVDTLKCKSKVVIWNKDGQVVSDNFTGELLMAPLIVIDGVGFYSYDRIWEARMGRTIQLSPRWKSPVDISNIRACPVDVKLAGKKITPKSKIWYTPSPNSSAQIIVGEVSWAQMTHYDRMVRDAKELAAGELRCYSWEAPRQLSLID